MPYNKPELIPGQFALYAINRMLNTTYEPRKVENGLDYNNPVPKQQFINAYIPIAFYDGKFSSKFSTYDENLQIKDNSQYSLSFSVAKYINNEINPMTEKQILANPISLITAVDSSSFSLNITLAVNSGCISCFIPARPNLSPTPLNTNHLSAIL